MSSHVDRMFDPPGPQGRRRLLIGTVASAIVLVAMVGWLLARFAQRGGLDAYKWNIYEAGPVIRLMAEALWATVRVALMGSVIAVVLALVLVVLRQANSRAVRGLSTAYVEVTRSLPTLLVLYFTILFLPRWGVVIPVYWQVVIALVVTNAAMISEIVRASLLSIPRGQAEAALSLGLPRGRVQRLILLPQAVRNATPALIAQLVYLLKTSTLGYVVSYAELLYTGRVVGEYTSFLLQSFVIVTVIFLVINLALSRAALAVQSRLARKGIRTVDTVRPTE